ncbi:MAG: nitroreductase [Pseudomonadota bacterium]
MDNRLADVASLGVLSAVGERKSVRAFRPDPVPEGTVREILKIASRAPSGTNTQPWRVTVVTGDAKLRLSAAVTAAAEAGDVENEYPYAPQKWWEPYLGRRRKVGYDLYATVGIARDDMAGRKRQALKNFQFFGAPVGLFFTMERALEYGSWIDVGLFMQNVMITARGFGLESCPQAAWCNYGPVVHRELAIPYDEVLISGMSLGHADWAAPENSLVTERDAVDGFTRFLNA